jgi:RND superfamily putative drug exporter
MRGHGTLLRRLGVLAHRRRGIFVGAWLALLVLLGVVGRTVGTDYSTRFDLPDVESAQGARLLAERFGAQQSGRTATIVVAVENGPLDPDTRTALETYFTTLDQRDDLAVKSPFAPENAWQTSPDGRVLFAELTLSTELDTAEEFIEIFDEITAIAPRLDGARIEYGGEVFATFEAPTSEALGLGFAVVILVLAFGSVLAMGLPIGTAFGGIGAGVLFVGLASNVATMPDFATTLGVMIGLGVGIDYALFIVTRYREARRRGSTSESATGEAIDTAGRAVLFAGITVVISLLGMLLMRVSFMDGMAIGASITVLATMLASVTLLPALLGFTGERIEITRWRGVIGAGILATAFSVYGLTGEKKLTIALAGIAVASILLGTLIPTLRRELPRRKVKDLETTLPYRWSRLVQRRPWLSLIMGSVLLLTISLPVLGLRLGFADEGNYPEDTTTRKAYDLLAEGFGEGFNGPLVLVADIAGEQDLADGAALTGTLAKVPGIASLTPMIPNDTVAPDAVLWRVYPTDSPQSAEAAALVERLREEILPTSGLDVLVTGTVAVNVDFSGYLAGRLPLFFAVVLALSFLLLTAVFRSLLVPLKAVLMNVISIAAAYGAVVAVFQWGWVAGLTGVGGEAPIDPWLPVMMFAIVFGLSMDYEVFLLSRVKEEYDRTGDNELAVADGLANTARVITAAAAIMVFVFGSFVLDSTRSIQMFGFGLAVAVLLDATVVRLLLVPATMQLLGARNWWLPNWIDRLLPNIDVEGASRHADEHVGTTHPGTSS